MPYWERAQRVMPGGVYGHQNGAAHGERHPRFSSAARARAIWDVDGNEYVDWMCAYGPMILGYGHPAVEAAVAEQLGAGDCLPLPGPRMVELAERLVALTPRADFAVFGKNGADATSWAVDVARAHTGRPRIARVAGAYHGARPWTMPRLPGVPAHYREELLEFAWNDLRGLRARFDEHPGEIAVVMTTPFDHATGEAAAHGFFAGIRALCDEHGAVFAMDDVRAGSASTSAAREHLAPPPTYLLLQGDRQRPRAVGGACRSGPASRCRARLLHGLLLLRERRLRGRAGHAGRPGAHRRHRAHPSIGAAPRRRPRRPGRPPRRPMLPPGSARDAGDSLRGRSRSRAHPALVLASSPRAAPTRIPRTTGSSRRPTPRRWARTLEATEAAFRTVAAEPDPSPRPLPHRGEELTALSPQGEGRGKGPKISEPGAGAG